MRGITFRGKYYPSYSSIADTYGISRSVLLSRLKRGMSLEEAISRGVRPKHTEVEYKGVKYSSYTSLSYAYGIPRNVLYARLGRGRSLDEAISMGVPSKSVPSVVEFRGRRYTSLKPLAKEFGLSKQTLVYRLRTGCSLEEALGIGES